MDNQQHQNMRDHKEDKKQRTNQESDHHQNCSSPSSSSNSSSPSHEFSFTISFQQTKQIPSPPHPSSSSSFAIDLSPADDIFFHGHLLPLHLLSHFPISSPRSSTNSLDSFTTLPKKDHFFHQVQKYSKNQRVLLDHNTTTTTTSYPVESRKWGVKRVDYTQNLPVRCGGVLLDDAKGKPKTKSFPLFGIPKWRKGYEIKENKERTQQQNSKKMSQVVKRYIKMVRPFILSFRNKKNMKSSYSFSGNLLREKNNKGEYSSAPASIRTSPTNSGLLVATPTGGTYNNCSNYSSESTMEELQSAIQAAIAHCKKSISMEDKINLP